MVTSIIRRAGWFSVGFAIPAIAIGLGIASQAQEASSNAAVPELPVQSDEAQEVVADALADAPASQSHSLDDDVVSFDEYSAAARANVACIQLGLQEFAAANYQPGSVEVVVNGPRASADQFQLNYTFGIRSRDGTSVGEIEGPATAIETRCQREFMSATQTVYQARLLADDDYVHDSEQGLQRCLSNSGIRTSGGGTARDALADALGAEEPPEAVVDCVGRFPSMTGTLESR
jgi:hypothetical protein